MTASGSQIFAVAQRAGMIANCTLNDTNCWATLVRCVCDQLPRPLFVDSLDLCKVWLTDLLRYLESPSCKCDSVNRTAF